MASDIVFNKYLLGLSPKQPEFRRGMLYAVNPVGFGSMLLAAGISIIVFFGGFGETVKPYSPLVAIGLALVLPPVFAVATKGRYYLRRTDDGIDLRCTTSTATPPARSSPARVPAGLRTPGHGSLFHPRRARLLAVPEHGQGR